MAITTDDRKASMTQNQKNKTWLFISGIFLLLVVLAAVMYSKEMNDQTFWVVRVIVSLAAAGYGSFIPGAAKAEYSGAGYKITGALVVGAAVFFSFPKPEPLARDARIKGIVFVNGKKAEGVNVGNSGLTAADLTGDFGEFDFSIPADKLPEAIMFDFRYDHPDSAFEDIDTSVRVSKSVFTQDSFEIRLTADSLPPAKFRLAGYVYDESGHGLSGVRIKSNGFVTETDDGGYFSFYVISSEREVSVNFNKASYPPLTYSYKLPNKAISVTLRQ